MLRSEVERDVQLTISSWFVRSISWLGSELSCKPRLIVERFRIGHGPPLIRLFSLKYIWNVAYLGLSQTIQLAFLKLFFQLDLVRGRETLD
jgi:hypothetical protein